MPATLSERRGVLMSLWIPEHDRRMEISAYDLAQRFVGVQETPGVQSNPNVLAMLRLDGAWPTDDSVPWCSAFVNYIAWLLRLPRSKSLSARSWLGVGTPVKLEDARPGFDVAVFWRGTKNSAQGHVGFFAGTDGPAILVLGGNQNDQVSIYPYPAERLLGIRRLA